MLCTRPQVGVTLRFVLGSRSVFLFATSRRTASGSTGLVERRTSSCKIMTVRPLQMIPYALLNLAYLEAMVNTNSTTCTVRIAFLAVAAPLQYSESSTEPVVALASASADPAE